MDLDVYLRRLLDGVEGVHTELEQLRILKEHQLGVRLEYGEHGPYVPKDPAEEHEE